MCTTQQSFLFFSSRRRHTILVSDWSSDVCSSDLGAAETDSLAAIESRARVLKAGIERQYPSAALSAGLSSGALRIDRFPAASVAKFLDSNQAFDIKNGDIEPY